MVKHDLDGLLDHAEESYRIPCRDKAGNPDYNAVNTLGDNLLHAAVGQDIPEVIRFLVRQGLDINARGDLYDTPLLLAYSLGKHEIVKLLIELGADPHLPDYSGKVPDFEFNE